ARGWRTCRSRKGEGGEADADLVPVQDGEVLGRIYGPTSRLAEAERLRVELDRAPKIGDGDSWLIAVESNHGHSLPPRGLTTWLTCPGRRRAVNSGKTGCRRGQVQRVARRVTSSPTSNWWKDTHPCCLMAR